MSLSISIVPEGFLYRAVPGIMGFLETAALYSRGRTSPDALLLCICSKRYQLWVVHDEAFKLHGIFLTEEVQYPKSKLLCIQHCVIEPNLMVEVEDQMQTIAERYARDTKCNGVEFVGRPGWKRHALKYGYKAQSVKYQKFFEEAQNEKAA